MNQSLWILTAILFVMMWAIGGKRGIASFVSMVYIGLVFMGMLYMVSWGFQPILCGLIASGLITFILLFKLNGVHKKTIVSSIAAIGAVILTFIITYPMVFDAKLQGFSLEQFEALSSHSIYVDINLADIVFIEILIGLLGAIIDVSISIASALNELHINHPELKFKSLFKSGMNIGRDILGTMTHTLLFAYLGGFFSILIWFSVLEYPITYTFNAKLFTAEIFQILCGGIGILLVIPMVTALMSWRLTQSDRDRF